jgi:tellurite resistance protein TerC
MEFFSFRFMVLLLALSLTNLQLACGIVISATDSVTVDKNVDVAIVATDNVRGEPPTLQPIAANFTIVGNVTLVAKATDVANVSVDDNQTSYGSEQWFNHHDVGEEGIGSRKRTGKSRTLSWEALRMSAWSIFGAMWQVSPSEGFHLEDNEQDVVFGDIFDTAHPSKTGKTCSLNSSLTGWLGLAFIFTFFVVVDAAHQRLTRRASDHDGVYIEVTIRSIFDRCKQTRLDAVSRRDLIDACQRWPDVATFFVSPDSRGKAQTCDDKQIEAVLSEIGVSVDDALTWMDFRASCLRVLETRSAAVKSLRSEETSEVRSHVIAVLFWLFSAVIYNAVIDAGHGSEEALQWASGYVLEWLLSFDNLFVYHLIFRIYRTPKPMTHFALFVGIAGAIIFRMIFFSAVSFAVNLGNWLRLGFGCLLIYSGIQVAMESEDDEPDLQNSVVLKMLSSCLGDRLLDHYDLGGRLFVQHGGRSCGTLLLPVIVLLEATDVIFAMDSVSAKVAQIPNYYICVSSSVIAMFGLRSLFFLVEDLVEAFEYLKYGLCSILVFIGFELLAADYVQLPASAVLCVIIAVFLVCIVGSWLKEVMKKKPEELSEKAA